MQVGAGHATRIAAWTTEVAVTSQHQPDHARRPNPGLCQARHAGHYRCDQPAGHGGWHHEPLADGSYRLWLPAEDGHPGGRIIAPWSPSDLSNDTLADVLDQWGAEQSGDQA